MPVSISVPSGLPFFDLSVDLDGATYTLELRWNVRVGAWFVRVLDAQGINVILGDVRVVADFPLWAAVPERQPPGLLAAIDTSGAGLDPGFNDLGERVQLTYVTAAELA